jgi:hydrogenase-1 operon protein HyaE
MQSPLIRALTERHGIPVVDETSVDAFLSVKAYSVLFFAGDAERLVESDDVAVILPELLRAIPVPVTAAVVASGEAERALQRRYRFNAFPALVFLRGDGYLGVLTRVLDWQDYLRDISEILSRDPSAPPRFELPEGCVSAGAPTIAANGEDRPAHPGALQ